MQAPNTRMRRYALLLLVPLLILYGIDWTCTIGALGDLFPGDAVHAHSIVPHHHAEDGYHHHGHHEHGAHDHGHHHHVSHTEDEAGNGQGRGHEETSEGCCKDVVTTFFVQVQSPPEAMMQVILPVFTCLEFIPDLCETPRKVRADDFLTPPPDRWRRSIDKRISLQSFQI